MHSKGSELDAAIDSHMVASLPLLNLPHFPPEVSLLLTNSIVRNKTAEFVHYLLLSTFSRQQRAMFKFCLNMGKSVTEMFSMMQIMMHIEKD